MITKIIKGAIRELIFGGHIQSAGSVGIYVLSIYVFDLEFFWSDLLLIYIVFYLIYLFDRYLGLKIDESTNPERTQHIKKYNDYIPIILTVVVLLFILVGFFFSTINFFLVLSAILILGLIYPVAAKRVTRFITGFKNFYVAAVFSLLIFLPVLHNGYSSLTAGIALLSSFVFLKAFSMQVVLDLKDISSDKQDKLKTFPVVLGIKNAIVLISLANLFACLAIVFGYWKKDLDVTVLSLLLSVVLVFFSVRLALAKKFLGYLLAATEFLLWPLLILLVRLL